MAATQLADPEGIKKDHGGENEKYVKVLKTSGLVLIVVFSDKPRHYTYLELLADPTKEPPWFVTYKDSLNNPSKEAIKQAQRILTNLSLQALVDKVAPVNRVFQEDGWSCGLWVLMWIEAAMRKFEGSRGFQMQA